MSVAAVPSGVEPLHRTRTVVVGFDGSAGSRRALAWAARRLVPEGRLVLVVATRPEPSTLGRPGLELVARDPLGYARLVLDEISTADGVPDVEVVVTDDVPAHALHELARERDADEIAIGGRRGRAEGAVAADLLAVADRPVVIVVR